MKVLGIVLAFVMLAGSAVVGFTASSKSRSAAEMIESITAEAGGAGAAELTKITAELPSAVRLKTGALFGLLGAGATAAVLIVTFVKKAWVAVVAIAAVCVTALSAAIYPHIANAAQDGLAPRIQALVATGFAVMGALGATLSPAAGRRR